MFIINLLLKIYTRHGKEYEVPKITGLKFQDIEDSEQLAYFQIIPMDSIFKEGVEYGTIISQDPSEGTKVKRGRKIYITIAASKGEIVRMPNCRDKGIKSAVRQLVDVGLRVGTIMYRTGEVDGVVIEQRYHGKPISTQTDIQSGESIDLVVEVSSTTKMIKMPDILSKTEDEAELLLWSSGLNVGKKVYQGKQDNTHTRVVSFSPNSRRVMIGSVINLNLVNDNESAYKKQVEKFKNEQQEDEQEDEQDTIVIQSQ